MLSRTISIILNAHFSRIFYAYHAQRSTTLMRAVAVRLTDEGVEITEKSGGITQLPLAEEGRSS
jgi:hypothetical protein